MKFSTASFAIATLSIQVLAGPDLSINFPGFLRTRVDGAVNLQTFTQALVSIPADPILVTADPKRPFKVGDSTFNDFRSAATRSCNNQKNACAEVANSKDGRNTAGIRVGDCDEQQKQCNIVGELGMPAGTVLPSGSASVVAPGTTAVTSSSAAKATLHSSDTNFFYFCDP
ncbi:hypothetical protein VTL71DRAFT_6274 [Oculimacula yallundae]|uniref:Uncharacterized protein n=1 Tax=Oculimacula yallundae TaxID=86028 RepID=A0ABR4BWI7_9HELO